MCSMSSSLGVHCCFALVLSLVAFMFVSWRALDVVACCTALPLLLPMTDVLGGFHPNNEPALGGSCQASTKSRNAMWCRV
jgi:hypothetical protein